MNKFDTTIYETNPNAYYIYNAIVNLHQGVVSSRQITQDKEFLFERITNTASSRVTFVGSDLRDGFLNIYLIVLDNGKAFLYLHGNAPNTPLSRGGKFMDMDLSQIDHTIIERYLKENVKKWTEFYSQRELLKLINAVNNSFNEILELMQ
ncbi:MAG: hypothetical protein IT232_02580 [Flavobacteriales bacterium]|nr:hypothetical protein [Flavobacteriales bacterium]